MNSSLKWSEAEMAGAGPEALAEYKRYEAASVETDKNDVSRAASQAVEIRATEIRIDQITKQLEGKSGLTNRERRALNSERYKLERRLNHVRVNEEHSNPVSENPNAARKLKTSEKKLAWAAKKLDAGGIILKASRSSRSSRRDFHA